MPGDVAKKTTDHATVQKWVEQRGGKPATVKGTSGSTKPGLLRIAFPDYKGNKALSMISWDEFFQKFDEKKLAFLYQDKMAGGKMSRFFKFVKR